MNAATGFAGLHFTRMDMTAALEWLRLRRGSTDFAYVVTPNVDHAVRLADHPAWAELHQAYRGAAITLCDSRVLAGLARLRGRQLDVVPGSDLTARFLTSHLPEACHLLLVGGDDSAAAHLAELVPHARISHHAPPMGLLHDDQAMARCVASVAETGADYVLLALGSPQQELIASRLAATPGLAGTALCIGASIDFLTGKARRAPVWMQRLALEWLHRLLSNPGRMWRRYLVDGPRILGIAFSS